LPDRRGKEKGNDTLYFTSIMRTSSEKREPMRGHSRREGGKGQWFSKQIEEKKRTVNEDVAAKGQKDRRRRKKFAEIKPRRKSSSESRCNPRKIGN